MMTLGHLAITNFNFLHNSDKGTQSIPKEPLTTGYLSCRESLLLYTNTLLMPNEYVYIWDDVIMIVIVITLQYNCNRLH